MARDTYYYFDIVTYVNEQLIQRVKQLHWEDIEYIFYCVHWADPVDLDRPYLGTKERHTHVCLKTHYQHSCKAIQGWFYDGDFHQNTRVRHSDTPIKDARYLMHLDDPKKYQYNRSEVFTFGTDYDSYIQRNEEPISAEYLFFRDVTAGMSITDLFMRYPNLSLRYFRQIDQMRASVQGEQRSIENFMSNEKESAFNDYCDYMFGKDTEE